MGSTRLGESDRGRSHHYEDESSDALVCAEEQRGEMLHDVTMAIGQPGVPRRTRRICSVPGRGALRLSRQSLISCAFGLGRTGLYASTSAVCSGVFAAGLLGGCVVGSI